MIRKFFYSLICVFALVACENSDNGIDDIQMEGNGTGLSGFRFLAKNNNRVLISDVECNIVGDSIIECHVPHIMEHKALIPNFDTRGGEILVDGQKIVSGITIINCARPVNLIYKKGSTTKKYMLRVMSFTGLPILYINTENGVAITSKETLL